MNSDGTITDGTEYHRRRIAEALGFGTAFDAIATLQSLTKTHPEMSQVLDGVLAQLFDVRALCADGDETD